MSASCFCEYKIKVAFKIEARGRISLFNLHSSPPTTDGVRNDDAGNDYFFTPDAKTSITGAALLLRWLLVFRPCRYPN